MREWRDWKPSAYSGERLPRPRQPRRYKDNVRRKIAAYHRFVQLGCIAQGLLQLLALEHRPTVWERFRS